MFHPRIFFVINGDELTKNTEDNDSITKWNFAHLTGSRSIFLASKFPDFLLLRYF
jgi:hypothetical protein